jgi:hypothetical protein
MIQNINTIHRLLDADAGAARIRWTPALHAN